MPLYPGSSRPKKAKKDAVKGASTASTISTSSKSSKPPVEKPQKDSTLVPPAPRFTEPNSSGYTSRKQPAPNLTKPKEQESTVPNVFEYLDSDTDSESNSDSEVTSSDEDVLDIPPIAPNAPTKATQPGRSRQSNPTVLPAHGRSRTSSIKSKESTTFSQPPGAFDSSPVAPPLQLARHNTARRPSTDGSHSVAGSLNEGSLPPEYRSLELVPEAYYPKTSPTLHQASFPPSPPHSPEEDTRRSNRKIRRHPKSSRHPTGYGLLAWRLSASAESKEPRLPPLYRRFEDLNHRVLLYLQDEISQLEEELRVLDDYEEMQRRGAAEQEGTKVMPASRRMDVQAQAYSSLHYRREEVMGALIQKTEQYNNALAAYSKVLQGLPRATETETETYRSWMKANNPIAASEMRFLDHAKDLISLTPQTTTTSSKVTPPVYTAIIIASAAIVLPLLVFSVIAEFSGRILVVALVGGAAAAVAAHYSTGAEHLVKAQDGWRCAALYFGFMTVAALCIS